MAELPLVEKYRPRDLNSVIGNYDTITALKAFAKTGAFPLTMILWGPFGSGKTTSAKGVVRDYLVQRGVFSPPGPTFPGDPGGRQLIGIFSPVLFISGGTVVSVDVVRGQIARFMQTVPPQPGIKKFVIVDEGDKLSAEAQGALQTLIEARPGTVTIWTTNFLERINDAIRSRAAGGIFWFKIPSTEDLALHLRKIASLEKVEVPDSVIQKIAQDAKSVREAVGELGTQIAIIRARAPSPLFAPPPPTAPPVGPALPIVPLEKAKLPPPPSPRPERPVCYLMPNEVDLLFNQFQAVIITKLKGEREELTATEKSQFDQLINTLTCIKGLKFNEAKQQVDLLARSLAVIGQRWLPTVRARRLREGLSDLAEKSISGEATPEEEAKLQDWLEEAERELPFMTPREAMERGMIPTPRYKVVASDGPPPYRPDRDGKILLGTWMEPEQAQRDVTWFEGKGFSNVRVEEE